MGQKNREINEDLTETTSQQVVTAQLPLGNMKLPRGVITIRDCYTTGPMHTSPPQGEKQVNSLNKRQGHLSTTYRFVTQEALRIHPSWSCSLRTLWPNSGHKPLKTTTGKTGSGYTTLFATKFSTLPAPVNSVAPTIA